VTEREEWEKLLASRAAERRGKKKSLLHPEEKFAGDTQKSRKEKQRKHPLGRGGKVRREGLIH